MCDCQKNMNPANPLDARIAQPGNVLNAQQQAAILNNAQAIMTNTNPNMPVAVASAACAAQRVAFGAGAAVLTLSATGTGAAVKLQSADGTVESIQGSLGTEKFTVDQLPDRAGIALGGATQLGADVLRESLKCFGIHADYIQFEGGSTGQLANSLKFITASIFGSLNFDTITPSQFTNNMQQSATLVNLTKPGGFILAANTALQMTVNNTVTVKASFMNCKLIPYTAPF